MTIMSVYCGIITEWCCLAEPVGNEQWRRQGKGYDVTIHQHKKIKGSHILLFWNLTNQEREYLLLSVLCSSACHVCVAKEKTHVSYAHTVSQTVEKGEHIRTYTAPLDSMWMTTLSCSVLLACAHTQLRHRSSVCFQPQWYKVKTTKTTAKCIVPWTASPRLCAPALCLLAVLSCPPSLCLSISHTHTHNHMHLFPFEDGECTYLQCNQKVLWQWHSFDGFALHTMKQWRWVKNKKINLDLNSHPEKMKPRRNCSCFCTCQV